MKHFPLLTSLCCLGFITIPPHHAFSNTSSQKTALNTKALTDPCNNNLYPLPTPLFFSTPHGSMMSDIEEANALASDSNIIKAIRSASSLFFEFLGQYRNLTIDYSELSDHYNNIRKQLIEEVKTAIQDDSTGKIQPIALDYDSYHQNEYQEHLEVLIGIAQSPSLLNIPAFQCILPPSRDYKNLLVNGDFSQGIDGWDLSGGSATPVVNPPGSIDKTSPVANKGSLAFKNMPAHPGYASISQNVNTTPGHIYLISGYVFGTPPGGDGAYSGGIDVSGARFLTSSFTKKTTHYPQTSNEIDEAGLHRRYYSVVANGTSMNVTLSGGAKTVFKSISVVDITSMPNSAMEIAQMICPSVTTTGDQDIGHYPQVEHTLLKGENLLDGRISMQKNVDQSPLKNAGHPYWYIDGHIQENHEIKFVNGLNGAHAIAMPSKASITTSGPVPCPINSYKLSLDIFVPENSCGKVNIQFSGTNLINNASLPKASQDFDMLKSGEWNNVILPIDISLFSEMAAGTFFRPTADITILGDDVTIANTTLIPDDTDTWTLINMVNPYASDRSWYQEKGASQSYSFTQSPISHDWGIALTGNTMFAPGAPASDFTMQTSDGIKLISTYDKDTFPPFSNGGIQSTQMIPSGHSFSISMTFTATSDGSGYEPTVALWTYGESQRGPESPIYHINAPGSDPITEFDCEMGSDNTPNTPPPEGAVYVRDGSYIGHAFGGHDEYIDMNSDGSEDWKQVSDFWDGASHTLVMSGVYQPDGTLHLTRKLDDVTFSSQDLGLGPFSPMYIKIALENPNWNSRAHIKGKAEIVIHSVDVSISPKEVIKGVTIPTIELNEVDYTWFTPGGGGAISYCPFPS